AQDMQKNFTPITMDSPEGLKEITSFRSFVQLPEERASQQLYQIDPESYKTAVGLGQQYRQMATQPIGPTTTPQTEQLRKTIEDEALNQLRLGSTIGAEERRGYEQAARAAQTARGNIFGIGPAVQEAAQIGAAGEQRKLARYGAAQSFLGSGQSTGDALKADIAFRDALRQNRLGAAANFIGGGPSIYNLANQRTAQHCLVDLTNSLPRLLTSIRQPIQRFLLHCKMRLQACTDRRLITCLAHTARRLVRFLGSQMHSRILQQPLVV
ncbi:MAG: hypothetical protein EBT07_10785, partial [Actinobacteria bacterium]|nr:hypothetical protein [Actinomycetota bacterium]